MPATWAHSDWITFPEGTPQRLSELRLHIQEMSNAIATGSYTVGGDYAMNKDLLQKELDALRAREILEAEQVGLAQGTRLGFTSARLEL